MDGRGDYNWRKVISSIGVLVDDFQRLSKSSSIYKDFNKSPETTIDNHNTSGERTLIVDDTKTSYCRSKNTYKRRRATKLELEVELASISQVEIQDDTTQLERSDLIHGSKELSEKAFSTLNELLKLVLELINSQWPDSRKKLAALCAFEVGLESKDHNMTLHWMPITSQYSKEIQTGEILQRIFDDYELLIYLVPQLIKRCWKANICVYRTLVKKSVETFIDSEGIKGIDKISKLFSEVHWGDIIYDVMFPVLSHYDISNDEEVEFLEVIVNEHNSTHYACCLDILQNIIKFQISQINNPRNFLRKSSSVQQGHLLIIKQLATFFRIQQLANHNANARFFKNSLESCHSIEFLHTTVSLFHAFDKNDLTYKQYKLSTQESLLLKQVCKEFSPIRLSKFVEFTSKIKLTTPFSDFTLLKQISGSPSSNQLIKRMKRSKISTGDLI